MSELMRPDGKTAGQFIDSIAPTPSPYLPGAVHEGPEGALLTKTPHLARKRNMQINHCHVVCPVQEWTSYKALNPPKAMTVPVGEVWGCGWGS